jgi:hypothetical protein
MQDLTDFFAPKEPQTGAEAMGVMSQNGMKHSRAIHKGLKQCRNSTELFVPERDCQVCLMKKNGHDAQREHHKWGPKNTKTNGRGEGSKSSVAAETYLKRMVKTKTLPLSEKRH